MGIVARLIICAIIIFVGAFIMGMLWGLYIGERKKENCLNRRKSI